MASDRRQKQVARRIQERLGEVLLHEMKDPRAGFITLTGVDVNRDLTVATVRYSVLGADGDRGRVAAMLEHAHGFLRTQVARALELRSAPDLVFRYDEGIERADRIDQILQEVLPEEEEPEPEPGTRPGPPGPR